MSERDDFDAIVEAEKQVIRAEAAAVRAKGHVPKENLDRYRRLVGLANTFRSLGGQVSGYGEYGDANRCWELEKKYRDKAQELRADVPEREARVDE